MFTTRKLPPEFLQQLESLEQSYLTTTDPIRQSGFSGGPERWRAERGPILEAIDSDGEFLDVGCANGFLLECLMKWGERRGLRLVPYGLDHGTGLIELARKRFPQYRAHFYVGNAWDWQPPRVFRFVYTLHDCVPPDFLEEYVHRLLARVVSPGGRLIIGAYGSRSQEIAPFDIEAFLVSKGFSVAGTAQGGTPPTTLFAWTDKSDTPVAPLAQ